VLAKKIRQERAFGCWRRLGYPAGDRTPLLRLDRELRGRLRLCAPEILWLQRRPKSHMYICGLKGLEEGVDEALIDITRTHRINWLAFKSEMHVAGRYHVEVY